MEDYENQLCKKNIYSVVQRVAVYDASTLFDTNDSVWAALIPRPQGRLAVYARVTFPLKAHEHQKSVPTMRGFSGSELRRRDG